MAPLPPIVQCCWLAGALLLATQPAAAQESRTNIYRYVLDVDLPESPGFVALDLLPMKVLRGSAPRPFMLSAMHRLSSGEGSAISGMAMDVVPYFLVGGGARTLSSYRANSVAGRLLRVLTKTALSVAASSAPGDGSSLLGAIALRTTFHDPHDPVLNSRLPEEVDSALAAAGVAAEDPTEESVSDRGVNLEPLYARAQRLMRARGDVQVSAGWGLAGQLRGGSLRSDSLTDVRHTLWITAQHATGHRFDVIGTVQFQPTSRDDSDWRFGAGLQRKSFPADLRLQLYFDTGSRRLHPGLAIDVLATRGLQLGAMMGSEADGGRRGSAQAHLLLLGHWYPSARR
jgi:hypothetical protein